MRSFGKRSRLSHATVWEHTAESVQPSLQLSVAARTKKKKKKKKKNCTTTVKHSHRIFLGVCMRVEKKKDCNQRESQHLVFRAYLWHQRRFRLICSMHLKELRPVFFQQSTCSVRTPWRLPSASAAHKSSFTQFQNGMELCELWANSWQSDHKGSTAVHTQRTEIHTSSWLGVNRSYFPVDSTLLLNIRHDTCSSRRVYFTNF